MGDFGIQGCDRLDRINTLGGCQSDAGFGHFVRMRYAAPALHCFNLQHA